MERKGDTAFQKATRVASEEFPSLRIFTQNATKKILDGEKAVSVPVTTPKTTSSKKKKKFAA